MNLILWMSGAIASFCLMAVGARELSGELSVFQILFVRSVIGLTVVALLLRSQGQQRLFRTSRLRLHAFRNVVHFFGQLGWFLGLGLLPLAEVFALEFTVPIWTALIAAFFLNETLTRAKTTSIMLGLLGVLVIVKPGFAIIDTASLIVLGAALCYAITHTSTKSLSTTEDPMTILFFMCLIQLPIGFVLSASSWVWPDGPQWLWLGVIGLTALTAHFCMTRAMQAAEVTTVVTLDFLRLPAIALVGILLYGEQLEVDLIIGAALMLLGNFIAARGSQPQKATVSN